MSQFFADFHFLRPFCLLGLPLLWLLAWRWRRNWSDSPWAQVVDPQLLPYLIERGSAQRPRWPLTIVLAAGSLCLLALAGPAWQQLPQPVFSAPSHRVLVLDLSAPMQAADLKPNRLQRAKLIGQQLLRRRSEGETALVAFAGDAFPVVPLSSDDATVSHLLNSLQSDLMPVGGQNLSAAIRSATELLDNARAQSGDIVLLTVSKVDRAAREAAKEARQKGYRCHVLASGTTQGAPVPAEGGGWHKSPDGGIRLARIDETALRELAIAGGGRYTRLDQIGPNWRLRDRPGWPMNETSEQDKYQADVWQDEGPWLLLPALLLCALGFRRGWLMLLMLGLPILAPTPASAGWWQTEDQQAYQLLQSGQAAQAAEQFRSRPWQASALYQAGEYDAAAEIWRQGEQAQDAYNLGNALARSGKLEAAIEAYAHALEKDPDMNAAASNKALLEELLKQQQEQQKQDSQNQQSDDTGQQDPQQQSQDSQQSEQGQSPNESQDQSESQSSTQDSMENPTASSPDAENTSQDQSQAEGAQDADAAEEQSAGDAEQTEEAGSESQQDAQKQARFSAEEAQAEEQSQAVQQWLNRIPNDPGGLLRRKFQLMQERRDRAGKDDESW